METWEGARGDKAPRGMDTLARASRTDDRAKRSPEPLPRGKEDKLGRGCEYSVVFSFLVPHPMHSSQGPSHLGGTALKDALGLPAFSPGVRVGMKGGEEACAHP